MLFNFAFDHFFIGELQNPQIAKNHILQVFLEKMPFLAICGFWGSPIKKMMKSKVEEH